VNNIVSAFDIIDALVRCDDGLLSFGVECIYENEANDSRAVIVVKDTLTINGDAKFIVEVRGFPHNGQSTTNITRELIKYNSYYQELEINKQIYHVRFLFGRAEGIGADEQGRTIIALHVSVQVNLK